MAWSLRQFFEGDRVLTVSGVASGGGSATCWQPAATYVASSIAVKFDGVERLFSTGVAIGFGIATIQIPSDIFIGPATTVQVYAKCEDLPASKTATLTAKPVNFQVTNSVLKACNPQVILNSDIDEYVRFFLSTTSGDYFNAKLNASNLTLSQFSYAPGDTGNIVVSNGVFNRPTTGTTTASLISNTPFAGNQTLSVTILSTNYFTMRLGYIEIQFTGSTLTYTNYLSTTEVEVPVTGSYVVGDTLEIEAQNDKYIIRRLGSIVATIATKTKTINYAVSSGTVTPSTSTVGTPVAWTLPSNAGTYIFTVAVGDALKFQKTVSVHSCADAINDNFNGTFGQPFSGNVSTNDVVCVGENTYYTVVPGSVIGGTVVLNQNGTFVFTPTTNYNGLATFSYNILCGAIFAAAEIIDSAVTNISYFDICNNVVANWISGGSTRCTACIEEKLEIDTNASCTGNVPRWVANPGGSACNRSVNLVETLNTRCQSCVNQKEVKDLNLCSPTYGALSWISDPNGTICSSAAIWLDNGSTDCQSCVEKKQQIDTNTCSSTYNQTRFVDNPGGTKCSKTPIYVPTDVYVCVSCVENQKKRDTNPCSDTYNQTVNFPSFTGNICNTLPVWENTGATRCTPNGVHQREQQSTNPCSIERTRFVNTGENLCSCVGWVKYNNHCAEDDVIGANIRLAGITESNRLLSFTNGVISFSTSPGTHEYIVNIYRTSGAPILITTTITCSL